MSHIHNKGELTLGKGSVLKMLEDTSEAPGSNGRYYTEVWYDGEESSFVPVVGNHWHKHHDEWMEVVTGRVSIYRGGKWSTLTPESGPQFVARRTTHGFKFFKGVKTVARERTVPAGDFKHAFFEDVFSGGEMTFLRAIRAFHDGDTYVALPFGIGLIDEIFTGVMGMFAKLFYPRPAELRPSVPPTMQAVHKED